MEWIKKYENTTNDYRLTNPKYVSDIKITFIYTIDKTLPIANYNEKNIEINKSLNVDYTLKEPGILSKDELLELLIKHKKLDGVSYNSYKIMKFNINSEDHEEFLYDDENDFSSEFNGVNNIYFHDTLGIFEDFNTVYVMFMNRSKKNLTLKYKPHRKNKKNITVQ